MSLSLKHYPISAITTIQQARALNQNRNFLLIENKDATNAIRVVFGAPTALVAAVQHISFDHTPTAGAFKLQYNGNKSSSIAFNANAAAVQTALRTVTGLSAVTVSGSIDGTGLTVNFPGFIGTDGSAEPPLLIVTDNTLNIAQVTEVQTVSFSSAPASGALVFTWNGQSTPAQAFGATQATLQAAFRTLTGLAGLTVVGTMATTLVVTFVGSSGPQPLIGFGTNTLQDSVPSAVTPSTAETTPGVAPVNTTPTVSETTAGTLVNGVNVAAGAVLKFDYGSAPIDAVWVAASTGTILVDIIEG